MGISQKALFSMSMNCSMCDKFMHKKVDDIHVFEDEPYCSKECCHAAGDRSACVGWDCGCTLYAKKRRLLNDHRNEMRFVQDFLAARGMDRDYRHAHRELTGDSHLWIDLNPDIDEDSDQEDPELALRNSLSKSNEALADKSSFVEAATAILDNRGLAIELEQSRMQMEDFRAQLTRKG